VKAENSANQTADERPTGDSSTAQMPQPDRAVPQSNSRARRYSWESVKKLLEIFGVIFAVLGVIFGVKNWQESYIDKAVEKKLADPVLLRKIAAESRPAVIFDDKESVIADLGAGQFIKDQKIQFKKDKNGWPQQITIDFTRHLANAPIISGMTDSIAVNAKRAKGFSWEFEINYIIFTGEEKTERSLYRLELVQ
jgi:hypothetical protein